MLDSIDRARSNEGVVLFTRAVLCRAEGDLNKAEELLQELVAREPVALYRIELANVHRKKLRTERSRARFEEAERELEAVGRFIGGGEIGVAARYFLVYGQLLVDATSLGVPGAEEPAREIGQEIHEFVESVADSLDEELATGLRRIYTSLMTR